MQHRLVTPPTEEPVSLEDAKSYLRVTHRHEDATIDRQRKAARRACENYARMSFCPQVWELIAKLPSYSGYAGLSSSLSGAIVDDDRTQSGVRLPRGPVAEITSIELFQVGYPSLVVGQGAYTLESKASSLLWVPELFPNYLGVADSVRIVYTAGVPAKTFNDTFPDIAEAICITLAALYDQRGYSQQQVPSAAQQLLAPYWTSPTFRR